MDGSDHGRRNGIAGAQLISIIERVERLIEDKKAVADDIKAVFAEAKSNGYTPKYLKAIIHLRTLSVDERQEDAAMMDLYMSAIGMTQSAPLFAAAGMMGQDAAAREAMIEALKTIAPASGEIVVKCGGPAVRVYRDASGVAHADEVVEREPAAAPSRSAEPRSTTAAPSGPLLPDVDEAGAEEMGRADAAEGALIIANPFPFGDRRRARWDFGWRDHTGSDGMGAPTGNGDDE